MTTSPKVEIRQARASWWNIASSVTHYLVVLHGDDGIDYALENPEIPQSQILRFLRVPPSFDRYSAGVVAAKAVKELTEMEPDGWRERWHVPLRAVSVDGGETGGRGSD